MKNVKIRRDVWLFILCPSVGLSIIIIALLISDALAIILLLWSFYVQHYTSRILCPQCSQPVGRQEFVSAGKTIVHWSPLTPSKCMYCGCNFKEHSKGVTCKDSTENVQCGGKHGVR
ncbi:MAG: hypothetical protein SFY80_13655 [Verrucomicrobiota bacterium]|nr:hypothetical protein [Verrucomicrobiota bacterium]